MDVLRTPRRVSIIAAIFKNFFKVITDALPPPGKPLKSFIQIGRRPPNELFQSSFIGAPLVPFHADLIGPRARPPHRDGGPTRKLTSVLGLVENSPYATNLIPYSTRDGQDLRACWY